MVARKILILNQRFGWLTVIAEQESVAGRGTWICRCDCGEIVKNVDGAALRKGARTSCGCKNRGRNSTRYKHGGSRTKLYEVFKTMHRRCEAKTANRYAYYGGRGISVCPEWRDYDTFRDWALSNGYSDGLSLDRIDNDGDYCPENCRWSDMREQSNNRRNNVLTEVNGECRTTAEWARILGVSYWKARYLVETGRLSTAVSEGVDSL